MGSSPKSLPHPASVLGAQTGGSLSLRAAAFAACPHPLVTLGLWALFLTPLVPTLFLVWAKEAWRGWGQPDRCQQRRSPWAPGCGLWSGSRPRSPPITTLHLGSSTRPGATGLPSGSQAASKTPQQPAALPGPSTGLPQGPRPPPALEPAGLLCHSLISAVTPQRLLQQGETSVMRARKGTPGRTP